MNRYLVTGGAGFIGSHLVDALLQKGCFVRVIDNYISGKKENLSGAWGKDRFEFIEGDIRDAATMEKASEGIDCVFHQAALGSVPRSVKDPMATHDVNVTGTLNVLIAARKMKVKRIVSAASSSAYGETAVLPKVESLVPAAMSPYAASKLAQEQYCHAFSKSYGLETISLRYFNVYGPRQDAHSQYAAVIPKFFEAFLANRSPEIYGDGEQTRDFTYVADVVRANILASECARADGQAINIAGGRRISINQLAEKIKALVGSSADPKYLPARAGDIRDSLADIRLAREVIGWQPMTSFENGLEMSAAWYRSYVPAE